MIVSYRDDATRDVHVGVESRAARQFGDAVRAIARRKLDLIGAAADIRDLAVPPGNRLEKLKGDLAGRYSIRVNDQYRIVFRFERGSAADVHLTDYH